MSQPQVNATNTARSPKAAQAGEHVSRMKWYDPKRRFGFIEPHDGRGDLWFNWLTLLRNGIDEGKAAAHAEMMVAYTYEDPDSPSKQRSIVSMRLIAG